VYRPSMVIQKRKIPFIVYLCYEFVGDFIVEKRHNIDNECCSSLNYHFRTMSTDIKSRRSLKLSQNKSKEARGQKHVKGKGFTTRHLAALDFLRTIHMTKEVEIVENGLAVAKRAQGLYDLDSFDPEGSDDEVCFI